jgi:hypothetical protein
MESPRPFCATKLCGSNTIEISFPRDTTIDIEKLASSWKGNCSLEGDIARIKMKGIELVIHPTGRILVKGTRDREKAVSILEEHISPLRVMGKSTPASKIDKTTR